MWRCFWYIRPGLPPSHVCSTHVEMFPTSCRSWRRRLSLLHACGDVSYGFNIPPFQLAFAPRMWRCFSSAASSFVYVVVCSTHVEMFLQPGPPDPTTMSLLHACGDVSEPPEVRTAVYKLAPRMWRCFHQDDC